MISQPSYKNKGKSFLLCFLALFVFFSEILPAQAFFKFETLAYTAKYENGQEPCNLGELQANAISFKWWEPLLQSVADASVEVGNTYFDRVKDGIGKFMVAGLGLWLAIFILKIVSGFQETDPLENLTKIGTMMFKVGLAYAFLMNRDEFFNLLSIITGTAAAYIGATPSSTGAGLTDVISPLFSMAEAIHGRASDFGGKGQFIMCISNIHTFQIFKSPVFTFVDFSAFASGCALYLGSFILKLIFPFFIFEVMVRVGVMAALCPLFIVAWPFPSTTPFSKKGFDTLLNIAFTLMFLNLAMDLGIALLEAAVGVDLQADNDTEKTKAICYLRLWGWGAQAKTNCAPYGGGDQASFIDMLLGLLVFCASFFYVFQLLGSANQYANFYSGAEFKGDPAVKVLEKGLQSAASGFGRVVKGAAGMGVKNDKSGEIDKGDSGGGKDKGDNKPEGQEDSGAGSGPARDNPHQSQGGGDGGSGGGSGGSSSGGGDSGGGSGGSSSGGGSGGGGA